MPQHQLKILNGQELTLSDLRKAKEDGYYVARTSHIGNQYLSNLTLLAAGFPAQLYDRNLTFFDENYWPSQVIINGKKTTICHEGNVLTPFGKICRADDNPMVDKLANGYTNLANFHFKNLEKLYGDLIHTESDFYRKQMEITEEISAIINFYFPNSFNRRISSRGLTYSSKKHIETNKFCRANSSTIIALQGMANGIDFNSFESGLLPTLSAVVVINTVLASLASNKDNIFELAGPDMANYMHNGARQNEVNKIYTTLAANFSSLPEQLTLTVVPTFHCRFSAYKKEMPALNNLIENLLQYRRISKEKKNLLKETKQDRAMTKALQDELRLISEPLSSKAIALAHEMHANSLTERLLSQDTLTTGKFFSHYDVLVTNETLHTSPLIDNFSMAECKSLLETLTQSKRMLSR